MPYPAPIRMPLAHELYRLNNLFPSRRENRQRRWVIEAEEAISAATNIADYQRNIGELKGDVKPIKWNVGFNLAFSVTALILIMRLLGTTSVWSSSE